MNLSFQYFLFNGCSCVGDVVLRDNMWPKRNRGWHWGTTCEPPSVPCIPSDIHCSIVKTGHCIVRALHTQWHYSHSADWTSSTLHSTRLANPLHSDFTRIVETGHCTVYIPCIRSLPVVTINVQTPRLTPRWHMSCKVQKRSTKMGALKKLEKICLNTFLLFLFLVKSG